MEKGNDIFGGFSAIAADLSGRVEGEGPAALDENLVGGGDPIRKPPVTEPTEGDDLTEEELLAIEERKAKLNKKKLNDVDDEDDEEEDLEDEEEEEEEIVPKTPKRSKKKPESEVVEADLSEEEPIIAEYLQEQMFDRFGFEIDAEENKFQSIDEVVGFVEEVIKNNSIPEFSSPDVANIDEYVRNGGDLHNYMQNVYGGSNLEDADINKESVQKAIIREDLSNQGMSSTRIEKRIERLEDSGLLIEEAEDSLDAIKEFRLKQEETLLEQQEKDKLRAEQANKEFLTSVESELEGIDNVFGYSISKAEKAKLFNYMFKPTSEGIPQYHIDYRKDRKNMIESAYFTMMGDKLVKKAETKATSVAAKKLKTKLADKRRGINQATATSGYLDSLSSISKALR